MRPTHDWSRVDAGIFHDCHLGWVHEMRALLNERLLPDPFYALAEPALGEPVPEFLTLGRSDDEEHLESIESSRPVSDETAGDPIVSARSAVVVQDLPPPDVYASLRRRIVIRSSLRDEEVVAVVEVVSRANKTSTRERERFVTKTAERERGPPP